MSYGSKVTGGYVRGKFGYSHLNSCLLDNGIPGPKYGNAIEFLTKTV